MAADTLPQGLFPPLGDPGPRGAAGPRPTSPRCTRRTSPTSFAACAGSACGRTWSTTRCRTCSSWSRTSSRDFDGSAKLRTWLYAIVVRIARSYRERAAEEASRFVADQLAERPSIPSGCSSTVSSWRSRAARFGALDQDKREVFVLAVIEQLSAPGNRARARRSLNTVYSRLRAARIAFDAQVARLQGSKSSRRSP